MLEGAGDGLPTECERCAKSGTPRQQFEQMGVTICHLCASERAIELQAEGEWACNSASEPGLASKQVFLAG